MELRPDFYHKVISLQRETGTQAGRGPRHVYCLYIHRIQNIIPIMFVCRIVNNLINCSQENVLKLENTYG